MNRKILGFDVSSSCIGYCLLEIDANNQIIFKECKNHKPIEDDNILVRLYHTQQIITDIIKYYNPDEIAIENIVEYMQGKSSSKSIITLAVFNRMICLLAYQYLQKPPQLFNVLSIRHGLKLNKILPQKEDMPELVSNRLGITFPYVYKKKGTIAAESLDMADAVAVALYYSLILTQQIIPKKPKAPKKSKKKSKNKKVLKKK